MEDFIKFLISPLMSDPGQLHFHSTDSTLTITVPQTDMGRVIGKHGQAVFHLRTLLRTYCKLHGLAPKYLQIQEG